MSSSGPNQETRRLLLQAIAGGLTGCAARASQTGGSTRASSHGPASGMVHTVLGALDASKLGFTLTHEHICKNAAAQFGGRANSVATAVDRLKEARDEGVQTIVDATTFDVGRDVRFGQEVSRKSGMHVIACTGQHMFAPESYHARTVSEITELFIKEIEMGIDGTDIKAGVIKVAARSGTLTQAEINVFKAAARASKATGVPVITHTNSRQRGGEMQAALFEQAGLSAERVALGHSNDTDDVNYLLGLAKRGFTMGMDHAFWGAVPGAALSWQSRSECIKRLIDAGFVSRVVLSNDWVFGDADRDKANPDGLLYTLRRTIPYLRQIGVSREAVYAMTVDNPKLFLVGRSDSKRLRDA